MKCEHGWNTLCSSPNSVAPLIRAFSCAGQAVCVCRISFRQFLGIFIHSTELGGEQTSLLNKCKRHHDTFHRSFRYFESSVFVCVQHLAVTGDVPSVSNCQYHMVATEDTIFLVQKRNPDTQSCKYPLLNIKCALVKSFVADFFAKGSLLYRYCFINKTVSSIERGP